MNVYKRTDCIIKRRTCISATAINWLSKKRFQYTLHILYVCEEGNWLYIYMHSHSQWKSLCHRSFRNFITYMVLCDCECQCVRLMDWKKLCLKFDCCWFITSSECYVQWIMCRIVSFFNCYLLFRVINLS